MTTHSRELTTRLATAGLLLVGLVGCTGDDPPETGPPSSSTSPSSSPSPTESGDGSESSEPTTTSAPATGEPVTYDQFQLIAPEGWRVGRERLYVRQIKSPPARTQIPAGQPFGSITISAGPSAQKSLDELARADVQAGEGKRVEDYELDGETVYHVSKPDAMFETTEVYGLVRNGQRVSIRFSMIEAPRRVRQEIVDSVLATWEWAT